MRNSSTKSSNYVGVYYLKNFSGEGVKTNHIPESSRKVRLKHSRSTF